MRSCLVLLSITVAGAATAQDTSYVMGMEAYPFSHDPPPAKGAAWANGPFDIPLIRVSDRSVDGFSADMMRPFYAKHDHENADGSLVMLHDGSGWHLYRTSDWGYVRQLPSRIWGWSEPRWDPDDADVFTFVDEMTFNSFDISTDEPTLLHDFAADYPGASKVWNEHEGDSSLDGRFWAFKVVDAGKVICYDREGDVIVGEWDDPDANWVGMSMTGDYVVLGATPFTFLPRGGGNPVNATAGAWGHADLALDAQGRDVIFYMNNSHDWYSYTLLETGEETRMYHVEEWGFGAHMSGNAAGMTPGWGLVSTFFRGADDWSTWQPSYWMYNAVYMVELSPTPRIWRVAHAMTASTSYWEDTMATINRAGTRVYWGSNWMDPARPVDTYAVELPEAWFTDLSRSDFDAGPPPDGALRDAGSSIPDAASATDAVGAPDSGGRDTAGSPDSGTTIDATTTRDAATARDTSAAPDAGSCVPRCLDDTTLESCDQQGRPVSLRCPSGQRCEEAQCAGTSDGGIVDAADPEEGCSCRSSAAVSSWWWVAVIALAVRRATRR